MERSPERDDKLDHNSIEHKHLRRGSNNPNIRNSSRDINSNIDVDNRCTEP